MVLLRKHPRHSSGWGRLPERRESIVDDQNRRRDQRHRLFHPTFYADGQRDDLAGSRHGAGIVLNPTIQLAGLVSVAPVLGERHGHLRFDPLAEQKLKGQGSELWREQGNVPDLTQHDNHVRRRREVLSPRVRNSRSIILR